MLKTFWDEVASHGLYHMGPSIYRLYILDRLRDLGVTSILEEGCGTGPIYQLIRDTKIDGNPRWSFTYKGTDFATEMVKTAKDNFPEANIEYQDARHPTEANDSYDCVMLIDALDHLDDYKSTIAEAVRISKKYICISLWRGFPKEGTNLNSKNHMNRGSSEPDWEETYLQEYSQKSLLDEFMKNNLELVEVNTSEFLKTESPYRSLWILKK